MKTCFIINYWSDTEEKNDMVCNFLNQLKKTNYDLVYTSLTPINEKISTLTKYSLYHSNNELITLFDILEDADLNINNTISFDTKKFKFYSTPLNYYDVSFSVNQQLVKNLMLLKELGYTHFHFMVGDCDIDESELSYFFKIEDTCRMLNKKAYFDDLNGKFDGYGAIYFFSEIDFFLKRMKLFDNKIDFIKNFSEGSAPLSFEAILSRLFMNNKNVLLGNNNSEEFGHIVFFKKSKIDLVSSYHNKKTEYFIIPQKDKSSLDFIIIVRDNEEYDVVINGESIINVENSSNRWYSTNREIKPFELKIIKNKTIIFNKFINLKILNKLCNHTSFYV